MHSELANDGKKGEWDEYYPAQLRSDGGGGVPQNASGRQSVEYQDPFNDSTFHGNAQSHERPVSTIAEGYENAYVDDHAVLNPSPEGYHPSMYDPTVPSLESTSTDTARIWRTEDPFAPPIPSRAGAGAIEEGEDFAYSAYGGTISPVGADSHLDIHPLPTQTQTRTQKQNHGYGHEQTYRPDTAYSGYTGYEGYGAEGLKTPATGELLPWLKKREESDVSNVPNVQEQVRVPDVPAAVAHEGLDSKSAKPRSKSKSTKTKTKAKPKTKSYNQSYTSGPRSVTHVASPPDVPSDVNYTPYVHSNGNGNVNVSDNGYHSRPPVGGGEMQIGRVYAYPDVGAGSRDRDGGEERMPVRPMMAQTPAGPRFGWDESVIPAFR